MSGENLPLVGKLLGHRRHRTTAGYVHLSDGHLVEAAEAVGTVIADTMQFGPRVWPGAIAASPSNAGGARLWQWAPYEHREP